MITPDYTTIILTNGLETIVDSSDADLVRFKWRAQKSLYGYYAARWNKKEDGTREYIYLHRVILSRILNRSINNHEQADHENNNKLDNRRSNIRLASVAENNRNIGISKNNTSGYKGVSWNKQHQRYEAYIWFNRKKRRLGLFDDPKEAHKAYCNAAKELHGEFARLE